MQGSISREVKPTLQRAAKVLARPESRGAKVPESVFQTGTSATRPFSLGPLTGHLLTLNAVNVPEVGGAPYAHTSALNAAQSINAAASLPIPR
jgi:hypothetical protein